MHGSLKKVALAALICAPWLSACTTSPETTFDWGVNDHLPKRSVARNEVTRSDLPRAHVRQGSQYAAPKPHPSTKSASVSRNALPAYQAPRLDTANAPSFVWPVSGEIISNFGGPANGERNDGINIATPMGTPIHAAASG